MDEMNGGREREREKERGRGGGGRERERKGVERQRDRKTKAIHTHSKRIEEFTCGDRQEFVQTDRQTKECGVSTEKKLCFLMKAFIGSLSAFIVLGCSFFPLFFFGGGEGSNLSPRISFTPTPGVRLSPSFRHTRLLMES